jgi:hypothetical protein
MSNLSALRKHRSTSLHIATFTLVIAGAFLGAVASGAAIEKAKAPQQKLASALAAAIKKGSVRVTVQFASGKTTGEVVQDSTKTSGIQTVAIGKERISILLSKGTAYFTANEQGFESYFGFPQGASATLSGEWVSVIPSDPSYGTLTSGMMLNSALKEVTPTSPLLFGKASKVNGQSTLSIAGDGSPGEGRTTLFVARRGTPLPVEAVSEGTDTGKQAEEIVTFSRWGEKVKVPVPTKSIPISDLPSAPSTAG